MHTHTRTRRMKQNIWQKTHSHEGELRSESSWTAGAPLSLSLCLCYVTNCNLFTRNVIDRTPTRLLMQQHCSGNLNKYIYIYISNLLIYYMSTGTCTCIYSLCCNRAQLFTRSILNLREVGCERNFSLTWSWLRAQSIDIDLCAGKWYMKTDKKKTNK